MYRLAGSGAIGHPFRALGRGEMARCGVGNGIFHGAVNVSDFSVSGYAISSSFWHRDAPSQQALLDVIDARVKVIRVRDHGFEKVAQRGSHIKARHYSIWGEIRREVWYDPDCGLARTLLPVSAGVPVTLELQ